MKAATTDIAANDAGDLVSNSRPVVRDLSLPAADLDQLRAILAAHVVRVLDARRLSVRDAEKLTGTPYADFSRLRKAKLNGFTVDRLMTILIKLDQEVRVTVDVQPQAASDMAAQARLL